eukprot:2666714-Prymnesium_polylepis.1
MIHARDACSDIGMFQWCIEPDHSNRCQSTGQASDCSVTEFFSSTPFFDVSNVRFTRGAYSGFNFHAVPTQTPELVDGALTGVWDT